MEERTGLEGALLRMERVRQQRGQKEICHGICVPSYLSKIEHGSVCPDEKILAALFARLGIHYEEDPGILKEYQERIGEYFYRLEYQLDRREIYEKLKAADTALCYSRYAIDWLLIKGFEKEDVIFLLDQLKDRMSGRQTAWYQILCYEENPASEEGFEACRQACGVLGTSFALVEFCAACLLQGDYTAIHRMENRVVAVAVEEGNTYQLASYFFMKGNAYACLNLEEMMMDCYERGIRLLQNTAWKTELLIVYYNIGATYISLKEYGKAVEWLDRALAGYEKAREKNAREENARRSDSDRLAEARLEAEMTTALHKKALALARSGRREEAGKILQAVKERLLKEETYSGADYLKYEEACMECQENFMEKAEYHELLERLCAELKQNCHFGHLYFYRDVISESYKRQRKYKKALEFEQELASRIVRYGF
ncbi:MAG: helix-turn-helix transcriptional regulator [Eubacteriales bacterium]|nr:helix-turn-helix transcriptional regulator [Eubacteriales bacterium]